MLDRDEKRGVGEAGVASEAGDDWLASADCVGEGF
jgi:hypothetical protein